MTADTANCLTTTGHGTHVAGLIGANGAVVGMAPDVTFGAYSCHDSGLPHVARTQVW